MNEQKVSAVLYVRRSSDKQYASLLEQVLWGIGAAKKDGVELNVTETMLHEAVKQGLSEIGDLYLDDAITGADLDRSGLNRMRDRMRGDEAIRILYVWQRDRIARPDKPSDGLDIENEISENGKSIFFSDTRVAPRDFDGDHLGDDLKAYVEYEAARKYRVTLAKNVCLSRKSNVQGGFWNGGVATHGFERVVINQVTCQIDVVPPGETRSGVALKVAVRPGSDLTAYPSLMSFAVLPASTTRATG